MIDYPPELIDAAVGQIRTYVGQVGARLDEINSLVRSLTVDWDGLAWGAYNERQGTWSKVLDEMSLIVNLLGQQIDQALQDMQATDARLAAGWHGSSR